MMRVPFSVVKPSPMTWKWRDFHLTPTSVLKLSGSMFHRGSNGSTDGCLRRFYRRYFKRGHIARFFAFWKAPCIAAFRLGVAGDVEHLDDALPNRLLAEHFDYRDRLDMSGLASVHHFDDLSKLVNPCAHDSSRSAIVQILSVTPAAIAGVIRRDL